MNTKILNISDLYLNYDFTTLFNRLQVAEEFERAVMKTFKETISHVKDENVKYVVLSGQLFDEETLLVSEVDELVEFIGAFEGIQFVIVPEIVKDDSSWYNIINWPDNVKVLSFLNDFVKYDEDELIIYRGHLNESLSYLSHKKVCVIESFEAIDGSRFADCYLVHSQPSYKVKDNVYTPGTFLPYQFRVNNKNGYIVIDLDENKSTHRFVQNNNYRLTKELIALNETMTLEDIINTVNNNADEGVNVYYEVEFSGKVNNSLPLNLVHYVKDMISNKDKYVRFINKTKKDYNIESIKQENADNLIGLFIDEIQKGSMDEEDKQKIIEYGLDYLL